MISGSDLPDIDPLATGERNRGAFSLIAISDDRRGVELVFQTDNVLVLDDTNTAFPIGDVSPFDPTGELRDYELVLSNSGYQLFVSESNVSRQAILSGDLRGYQSIASGLTSFVYTTPNFLFFGDDSGRGAGSIELGLLEAVMVAQAASWHNAAEPTNVNNDAQGTTEDDALLIIEELSNPKNSDPETGVLEVPQTGLPFLDVNDSGFVSPFDALLVINVLPSSSAANSALGIAAYYSDPAGQSSSGFLGQNSFALSSAVPEPSASLLIAFGLLTLGWRHRNQN